MYDKMIQLKVATPQIVINYAHYLEENKYFEDSFQVFEKAVTLFKPPHVHDLWLFYLQKFVKRYKGRKLERARDLFEEAIKVCEKSELMQSRLHILYAQLEEKYGLAKKGEESFSSQNTAFEYSLDSRRRVRKKVF
jgi:pre-mRNA-splicing factor SYF1